MASNPINKLALLFALLACLMALVHAAPDKETVEPSERLEQDNLQSCKKSHVKEDFKDSKYYKNAPTKGPFHYARHGIKYYNLARVPLDKFFGKYMIGRTQGAEDFASAAVCAVVLPNGTCLQDPGAVLAIKPKSRVHAFKMNKLTFFCVKDKKPTPCTMEFIYSEKSNHTTNKMNWQPVGPVFDDEPLTFSDVGGWGTPEAEVVFRGLPPLQAFALRLKHLELTNPRHSTAASHKSDQNDRAHITAYIDNIEFTVWKCKQSLAHSPLGGYMHAIQTGESPFDYFNQLPPQ